MGLTGALGRAVLVLTTDGAELEKGLDKATKEVKSELNKLGADIAGAFAVAGVVELGKQVIDFASHLTDLSQKTGISTTGLQKLELVFQQSGITLDTVTGAVAKLSKNIVGGDASAIGALTKLGLSVSELKAMAPDEMFIRVADKIGAIQNPTEKAYAAMAIFGKGGAELLAGLDGHLAETTKKFEAMGLIIDEHTIKAADDFGDQLGLLFKQLLAVVATIVGPLLPALSALGTVLSAVGNVIGSVLNVAVKSAMTILGIFWEGLSAILGKILSFGAKLPGVGKQFGEMADWFSKSSASTTEYLKHLWDNTDKVGESAKNATPPLIGLGELPDGPIKSLLKSMDEMVIKLTPLPGHFVLISAQAKVFGEAAAKIVAEADVMGVKVPAVIRNIANAWEATEIDQLMAKTVGKWTEDLNKMNENGVRILDAMSKNFVDDMMKNENIIRAARRDTSVLTQQLAMTDFVFQVAQIQRFVEESKREVATLPGNHAKAFQAIEQQGAAKMALLLREHNDKVEAMKAEMMSWQNTVRGIFGSIPGFIEQAFTGGGNFGGALKALSSRVGSSIFGENGPLGFGAGGVLNSFGNKLASTFGTGLGLALPGIGSALGSLLGPALQGVGSLIGKLFSNPEKQINPIRDQFVAQFGDLAGLNDRVMKATGSLQLVQQLLGAKNADQFKAAVDGINSALDTFAKKGEAAQASLKTITDRLSHVSEISPELQAALQKVFDAKNVDDYTAALAGVTTILDTQDAAQQHVADSLKELGLSALDAGEQYKKAELDKQAAHLADLYHTVRTAGVDVNLEMEKMGPSLDDFVAEAQKAGVAVPESMREVLQVAIDSGNLYDENGDKVKDLESLHLKFSEDVPKAMEHVADTIKELTKTLQTLLGPAISDIKGKAVDLAGALDNATRPRTVEIDYNVRGNPEFAASGGIVTRGGIQHFGIGGVVKSMAGWMSRGTDTVPAMLTPGELVLNAAQQGNIAAALANGNRDLGVSALADGQDALRSSFEGLKRYLTFDLRTDLSRSLREALQDGRF